MDNEADVPGENRATDGSPRSSIDMKATIGATNGSSRQARSARRHQRSRSEDVPTELGGGTYAAGGLPPPPMMGGYNPGVPFQQNVPLPRSRDATGAPPRRSRRVAHHRVQSMPNSQNLFFSPMAPGGAYAYSPAGNPLIPILPPAGGETGPLLPYVSGSPKAAHHKRKSQAGARPRANSGSGEAMYGEGTYGSFRERTHSADFAPPPPATVPTRPGSFSPRDEFMTLTGGFTTRTGRKTPPHSPRSGPQMYPMSPRMSPHTSLLRSGASPYPRSDDVRVSFSPGTPLGDGNSGMPPTRVPSLYGMDEALGDSGEMTGEGVFQSNKRGKNRRAQSVRKMHMRQQSAQLFMEDIKGVVQPTACRDVLFAVLFVLHLVGMAFLGWTYSRDALMSNATDEKHTVNLWYRNVIFVASLCGIFAVLVSTLALIIMTVIARRLVQAALMLTIALSFAWGTIGIGLSPKNVVPITGIIALALSVGYTLVVWDRIPFTSANLYSALSGVRDNAGTVLIAFAFQFLAFVWSIYYTFVVIGVYDALETGDLNLSKNKKIFVYSMLGISFYWTFQVLLNVVQVTVAGTIGSWWYKPGGESSFCDPSVSRSFYHAMFHSFGSICFGSLLVGPVRLIRQVSAFFRPNQEESILMCLHECLTCAQQCIASCVDNVADHFNPWAFTYIGLYGYGLLDAGHNATMLFQKRGWSTIVSDDLVPNVLLMVSLVVAGVTACFGTLIQSIDELSFSTLHEPFFTSFVIGLYMGLIVSSVLFGIISSSVNAVIVCFAGSPVEFEKYHPELSAEMRAAWREVWPGCMDVVDLRAAIAAHESPHVFTDFSM